MSTLLNRKIVLASRPHGMPTPANFALKQARLDTPEEGEMLLRNVYLSLDPYMRGSMN